MHALVVVTVTNEYFESYQKVRFMMDKRDGRAIMTQNWREVVEGAMIKEGEMVVFRFIKKVALRST